MDPDSAKDVVRGELDPMNEQSEVAEQFSNCLDGLSSMSRTVLACAHYRSYEKPWRACKPQPRAKIERRRGAAGDHDR